MVFGLPAEGNSWSLVWFGAFQCRQLLAQLSSSAPADELGRCFSTADPSGASLRIR